MANKVLVIPTGLYLERVWKSIVRSGADKIYLIADEKPEYDITQKIASNIEMRIREARLITTVLKRQADLSSRAEVYRVLIGIIERERSENPDVKLIIDLTSTTKVVLLAASSLAGAYNITLTYVPGKEKLSKNLIERVYQARKDDLGSEVQEIEPVFSTQEGRPLAKDEIRVLYKLEKKAYESITELIKQLASEEDMETLTDAYEKNILRTVRGLQGKGLIVSREWGRTKQIELSAIGKGVAQGLKEAEKSLKEDHLKPLFYAAQ